MKKTALILLIAAVLCAALSLTGCINISSTYDNADKYTSGDREIADKITRLDINWNTGSVTVKRGDTDKVIVKETCAGNLSDKEQVHTWVDGEVLRVQFSASGEIITTRDSKNLSITVPNGLAPTEIDYDGTTAEVDIDGFDVDIFKADTSTGRLNITNCSAREFKLESSTGEIDLDQHGTSDLIQVDSSTGDVRITAEAVKDFKGDLSTAKLRFETGSIETVALDTSTGDATLSLGTVPKSGEIESSTGDITVWLPKDPDLEIEADTSTGKFTSDLPCSSRNESYVYGNGSSKLRIDTSTGDIKIKEL